MFSRSRRTTVALLVLAALPATVVVAQDKPDPGEGIRIFEPGYFDEYEPDSALQMVWRTPGFNPQESDGGRGLSGVRSNILINGKRPPPKGQSVRQQLRETPVAAVARIELIDAGARLDLDMQGYPQVVNVITVENRPAYYEVNTQIQRTGTGSVQQQNQRNTEVDAIGSFSWQAHEFQLGAGVRDRDNRYPADFVAIDPANPEQRISSLSHWQQYDRSLELGGVFSLPGDSSLNFTSEFSARDSGTSPILLDGAAGDVDEVRQASDNIDDRRDMSAEYRRPFASRGELLVAVVDDRATDRSLSALTENGLSRSSNNDRESGETAARLLITNVPGDRLTVRTTVTNAFNYFEGAFRLFENGAELPIAGSDSRVEEDRRSVDTAVDWNPSESWTISGNLGLEAYRIESHDVSSGNQADPKGGFTVSLRPRPRTTISFASNREIGQLSFGQFLASSNLSSEILTAGASELEPVRRWIHEVVYDRRFGDVGVLRFELEHEERENPIRSVALSDSLVVAQNTSPQMIDSVRASIDYPFARFNREDLILSFSGGASQSDTVDPVTGEIRQVSGNPWRFWNLELRRDQRAGSLAWGVSVGRQTQGSQYSVRSISDSDPGQEWGGFVEWEPIDGVKLRTELNGPRTETWSTSFFPSVRAPGLDPSFVSGSMVERDRQASISVELRRWEHFEIRASLRTEPRIRRSESLTPFGDALGTFLTNEVQRSPRAWVRFRFFR